MARHLSPADALAVLMASRLVEVTPRTKQVYAGPRGELLELGFAPGTVALSIDGQDFQAPETTPYGQSLATIYDRNHPTQ